MPRIQLPLKSILIAFMAVTFHDLTSYVVNIYRTARKIKPLILKYILRFIYNEPFCIDVNVSLLYILNQVKLISQIRFFSESESFLISNSYV
jgi:hypothetical protein